MGAKAELESVEKESGRPILMAYIREITLRTSVQSTYFLDL